MKRQRRFQSWVHIEVSFTATFEIFAVIPKTQLWEVIAFFAWVASSFLHGARFVKHRRPFYRLEFAAFN